MPILEADHYGSRTSRIDHRNLAVRKLKTDERGTILCLDGPPGVARPASGNPYPRPGQGVLPFSRGGHEDEAEIKGQRRTYVGASPVKIVPGA
jgi:ATP-dependent Lon protease